MWSTEFAGPSLFPQESVPVQQSQISRDSIESIYVLQWFEHCLECALPDCFRECSLYVKRRDGRCARLREGMVPDYRFRGLLDYGINIHFRRWAKIETQLWYGVADPLSVHKLSSTDLTVSSFVKSTSRMLEPVALNGKLIAGYTVARRILLQKLTATPPDTFEPDDLVIELWNLGEAFNLIVEAADGERLSYRASLPIVPGHNLHRIPYRALDLDILNHKGRLLVRPAHDVEAHVVFTWLDLVRYRERPALLDSSSFQAPADKVKCVVWDLDETLWDGTLADDGPEGVTLRQEVLDTIHALDERGILQSIASKNDPEPALLAIRKFDLQDYFLYPAIGWHRKSEGIRQIASHLNLGLDTFAFIDDSSHERAEVHAAIPCVRTFAESQVSSLLTSPPFQVPVTNESRSRRQLYLREASRKKSASSFLGDQQAFLRSCDLHAHLFLPSSTPDKHRCLELLQRSNQLNLRTYRYGSAEFEALLKDPQMLAIAARCEDKYGDYGIIGLATLMFCETPLLCDLVISCRVAGKYVEHALFRSIAAALQEAGYCSLQALFVPTPRNSVLLDTLHAIGFREIGKQDGSILLQFELSQQISGSDIVQVTDSDVSAAIESHIPQQDCEAAS